MLPSHRNVCNYGQTQTVPLRWARDRSDCRRRHHVGYRLTGLSGARHLDRGKSSPTPEAFPILVCCTPMLGTDPRARRLEGRGRPTFTTHHFEA